jgi:hypothetical protein
MRTIITQHDIEALRRTNALRTKLINHVESCFQQLESTQTIDEERGKSLHPSEGYERYLPRTYLTSLYLCTVIN